MSRVAFTGALMALLAALLACVANPPTESAQSLKILVATPGVYRLTRGQLQSAGFAPIPANLARLHVTHREADIPIALEQNGDGFAITFYAAPQLSAYSSADVYWLALGDTDGARITTRAVEPPRELFAVTYTTTLTLAENRLYSASPFDGVHWFWQSFTAPVTRTLTTTLTAVGAGDATLRVALAGATEGAHRVEVLLNDQPVGEARWNGRASFQFTATTNAVRVGENAITLRAPGAEDQAEVNLLDAVTLTYPREFVAQDDTLTFRGGAQSIRARGFRALQPLVYDITDAEHPQQLGGVTLARDGDTTTLAFHDALPDRAYVAFAPSAAQSP
ncbi:MAG: hypothetical protein ABI874_02940, partial [Chloroflexota bacterium]